MQPAETWSVFEATQNADLMNGLCLVTESSVDVSCTATPVAKGPDQHHRVLEVSDRMYCSACSRAFESREEQTGHYRLDWHRFNLKQQLLGRQFLTVEEFEAKNQAGDVSSISGSDSSDTDSDSESDPPYCQASEDKENDHKGSSLLSSRAQRVLFRNSQGQLLSVYRCMLNSTKARHTKESEDLVSSLHRQSPATTWLILMAGGGHFAGAVFKGNEVLEHKTFHRYTVRARRGTSQGTRDAHGFMTKSAGATLRRYNEAALLKDIQELLASWAGHIQEAECIYLRAPCANRNRFFGSKNGPLQQDDSRIRSIPFGTRRATFREVQRVHKVLSCLQVYGKDVAVADLIGCPRKSWRKVDRPEEATPEPPDPTSLSQSEDEEREEGEEQLEVVEVTLSTLELREFEVASKSKRKRKKKPKPVAESRTETTGGVEEPETTLFRSQVSAETQTLLETHAPIVSMQDNLFTACKMGDLRTLQHFLGMADGAVEEGEECSSTTPQQLLNTPLDESGWTLLHVAAAAGRHSAVRLLLEAGADPALRDRQDQPPYCVSADKRTRNEFRRFMGEQPEKYNYTRALIPGPLTVEMEAKQAEHRRAQKAQRKQREKEVREAQQLLKQEEDEKKRFALLSDRDKRAVMAERRFAAQLKDSNGTLTNTRRCWLCGESLLGRIPFHYLDFSFCSTNCLQTHRREKAFQA